MHIYQWFGCPENPAATTYVRVIFLFFFFHCHADYFVCEICHPSSRICMPDINENVYRDLVHTACANLRRKLRSLSWGMRIRGERLISVLLFWNHYGRVYNCYFCYYYYYYYYYYYLRDPFLRYCSGKTINLSPSFFKQNVSTWTVLAFLSLCVSL